MISAFVTKKLGSSLEQTPGMHGSEVRCASNFFNLSEPGFINAEEQNSSFRYGFLMNSSNNWSVPVARVLV